MRQPIKLIIKKGDVHTDGTSLIYVQYCYSAQKRVLLSTNISIPAEYWNKKTYAVRPDLPPCFGTPQTVESDLRAQLRRAEQLVDYAIQDGNTDPVRFLKRYFHEGDNLYLLHVDYTKNVRDVFYQIDQYIQSKVGLVKDTTLGTLRQMKKHVKAYHDHTKMKFTFDTFKHLKSFLKDRIARKVIPYMDLSFMKYMEEEVDAIYLNWNELSTIYHLNLSEKPHLIKYRDMLVLACLTGFRFGDFTNLKSSVLRDGLLHVTQEKTGGTVIAPLHADARTILIDRYKMKLPLVSKPKFNQYIKVIARLAGLTQPVTITHKKGTITQEETKPKFAWVTSHIGRRSFCTNEYLAGTPFDLIMSVSGHRSERAFRRYIKADQLQKAHLIKKLWENRPGL